MRLVDLFPEAPQTISETAVSGLVSDSRAVKPGFVFVALAGNKQSGTDFIAQAVASGAAVIISEQEQPADWPHTARYLRVPDARQALARAAARFYPNQPQTIVAVTGTSGKTSVADFTRQIFAACRHEAASLGTIGVVTRKGIAYGSLTTPDPLSLHASLQALAEAGITHCAMEASSHGLEQRRLDGVRLKAAAFTNLGHDHLDYHATREAYLAAKLRLFDTLLPLDGVAVVNADDTAADAVLSAAKARGIRTLSVGRRGADLRMVDVQPLGFDQVMTLQWQSQAFEVTLPLAGVFQASNALVAAGLALAVGEAAETVFAALPHLQGVKGRLERVGTHKGGLILIDYAHKPDALAQTLNALRPFATGRVICVFGCGGDRDRTKRPLMGAIAHQKADIAIVTDDNPRSEDPASIRAAILAACPSAWEIGDRFEAIKAGMAALSAGDVLLIAGKGHETGQIFADHTAPFSDHEAVHMILSEVAA